MTVYNLDKGEENDINGQVLRDWINTEGPNISNLIIKDTGAATIENMYNLFCLSSYYEMEPRNG